MTNHWGSFRWGSFWSKSRKSLKTCWLIAAGIVAIYIGVIRPQERDFRGISSSKATGLASWERNQPLGLWRQMSFLPSYDRAPMLQKGVSGGAPRSVTLTRARLVSASLMADADKSEGIEESADRKLVRTSTLNLVVKSPSHTSDKIVRLALDAGGFLGSSQLNGGADAPFASLTIRVPAAKFNEVEAQIRALAVRVDEESIGSEDVTKQYVDDAARLRNLRAQEQQYLDLLRKAATVKDTLEVSDKLNEARGAIEEKQAEFAALSKQVETVAINIMLRAEADAQVFGLNWRPLYQLKMAAREGLNGLGDYVASMTFFVFYVPTIVLWLFTILAAAAIAWRILRWTAKIFLRPAKVTVPGGAAAQ